MLVPVPFLRQRNLHKHRQGKKLLKKRKVNTKKVLIDSGRREVNIQKHVFRNFFKKETLSKRQKWVDSKIKFFN